MDVWPEYPLQIPNELLVKLRAIHQRQRMTDRLCLEEDAVSIFKGLGSPAYLTLDGFIFQDDGWESGTEDLRLASFRYVAAYLRSAKWAFALPELLELLPLAPPGTAPCPKCLGAGEVFKEELRRPSWCTRCWSRSWVYLEVEPPGECLP